MDSTGLIFSISARPILLLWDLLNEGKVTLEEKVDVGIVKSRKVDVEAFFLRRLVSAFRQHSSVV
jgi:hypothetical protein